MVLLTKTLPMRWNSNNKKRYVDLNYSFTKMGEEFEVKVEHLPVHAKNEVKVECDYCRDIKGVINHFSKQFANYLSERKYIPKDSCEECKYIKMKENKEYRQEQGILTKDDNGWWTFRENRLLAVKEYLEKYHNFEGLLKNKEGKKLYHNIIKFQELPQNLAIELGYDLENELLYKRKPQKYYENIGKLIRDIQKIIDENKLEFFPTVGMIMKELKIGHRVLKKHGGYIEISRKMDYEPQNLVDNSGFVNRSKYERDTANYLIAQNLPYLREQYPFEGYSFQSDFTFLVKGNPRIIHGEVWGFPKDSTSPRGIKYNINRKIKEKLYKQYNEEIELISIEGPETFDKKTFQQIQENLFKKFSPFFHLPFEQVELELLIPTEDMSDRELFEKVMELSDDEEYLPETNYLKESGYGRYYNQIIKRYKYEEFARLFGKRVRYKENSFWKKEKRIEFFYM
ncbi:hypothetical protein [Metabacillus fastidiosus]|uniref:hypothetical protein n=1 Tax=Metabacillus fastidiosus TaxID=1458 RepID=UPI003D26DBF7